MFTVSPIPPIGYNQTLVHVHFALQHYFVVLGPSVESIDSELVASVLGSLHDYLDGLGPNRMFEDQPVLRRSKGFLFIKGIVIHTGHDAHIIRCFGPANINVSQSVHSVQSHFEYHSVVLPMLSRWQPGHVSSNIISPHNSMTPHKVTVPYIFIMSLPFWSILPYITSQVSFSSNEKSTTCPIFIYFGLHIRREVFLILFDFIF